MTGLPNPNFHFSDLNTDSGTVNMTPDRPGVPPEIEVRVHFETSGEELKINNFPNVDFDGLNIAIRLPIGFDIANGLVGLDAFVDLVEQAMRKVKVEYVPATVQSLRSVQDVNKNCQRRGELLQCEKRSEARPQIISLGDRLPDPGETRDHQAISGWTRSPRPQSVPT